MRSQLAGLSTAIFAGGLGGWLSDRYGPVPVLRASLVLSGAVLCVFPVATGFAAVAVAMVAWALSAEVVRPATFTAIGAFADPDNRGRPSRRCAWR